MATFYINAKDVMSALDTVKGIFKSDRINSLLKDSASFASTELRSRFKKEIDPSGRRWKSLSTSTLAQKSKRGYGGQPILVRRGKLRESIQPRKTGKGYEVSSYGTDYFKYHQSGGRKIPKREMVGVSKETGDGIAGLVTKYVRKALL